MSSAEIARSFADFRRDEQSNHGRFSSLLEEMSSRTSQNAGHAE
jgi:hypothetical protein